MIVSMLLLFFYTYIIDKAIKSKNKQKVKGKQLFQIVLTRFIFDKLLDRKKSFEDSWSCFKISF